MRSSVLTKQGWTTQQQGDTDRFNFEAQAARFAGGAVQRRATQAS